MKSLSLLLAAASASASAATLTVGFNGGNGGWVASTNSGEVGFTYSAAQGEWYTGHVDWISTTLTSPTSYNLGSSFTVTITQLFSSEINYDFGRVEFSYDGSNWDNVDFLEYSYGEGGSGFNGDLSPSSFTSYTSYNVNNVSGPVYLRLIFEADSSEYQGDVNRQWAISGISAASTPVPEPSTYGLMLGGLALAAVAVQRRRKSA